LTLARGAGRVLLVRYAFAPGVALSGTLVTGVDPAAGRLSGAVRVCGAPSVRGVLVLAAGGRLRGVLGSRRIGRRGPLPHFRPCG
jgi:hypothetical protein